MSTLSFPTITVKSNPARYGIRAPKGGCTVAGRTFKGGQFCLPFDPIHPHGRPVVASSKLAIHGFTYTVKEFPAGECGTIAFQIHKVDAGHHYEVIRNHFGQVTCDCPSYIFDHEGTAGMCKHGRALVAAGLIPAPDIAPARPVEMEATFDGRALWAYARDHRATDAVKAFSRSNNYPGMVIHWNPQQATAAYYEVVEAVEGGVR